MLFYKWENKFLKTGERCGTVRNVVGSSDVSKISYTGRGGQAIVLSVLRP